MNLTARCVRLLVLFCVVLASARAAEPAVPPALDAPWKVHQTSAVIYPMLLLRGGVTHGEARVRVSIAASGELLDALVISCTRPGFGEEAMRSVKHWRYEPAREKGESIGVVADIVFAFDVHGPIAIEKRAPAPNDDQNGPADPFAYQPGSLKQLDRIPTPTHVVPPIYPQEWADRGITGTATVEFFIDETGRVRVPVVVSTDHGFLGASAVAAVAQWKFEAPTRRSQPALVRAEQVFTFQPARK